MKLLSKQDGPIRSLQRMDLEMYHNSRQIARALYDVDDYDGNPAEIEWMEPIGWHIDRRLQRECWNLHYKFWEE